MSTPDAPGGDRREVRVRRSPRIGSFATTGVIAGLLATLILTFAFPENPEFPRSQVFGFLLLIFATVGALLGAVVALVVDRASSRRARTVAAERELRRAGAADGAETSDGSEIPDEPQASDSPRTREGPQTSDGEPRPGDGPPAS